MPLVECPDCNKEISDSARLCVYCGFQSKPNRSVFIDNSGFDAELFRLSVILGIIGIIIGVLVAFAQIILGIAIIQLGLMLVFMGTILLTIQSLR